MRGVFWRQFLAWATRNIPHYLEPLLMVWWTLFFFVLWTPGRRAVLRNLTVISPPAGLLTMEYRAYRVFFNFASTFNDTMHFSLHGASFDWHLEGLENFERLQHEERAIVLTAHMGNYDLGSYLFAKRIAKRIVIVRAAEPDEASDRDSRTHRERVQNLLGTIQYVEPTTDLAIELVSALQNNSIVAIQGDRVIEGVASRPVHFFGKMRPFPAGPFALALVTAAPLYPLFVVRQRRRHYRVIAAPPITVQRTGRDRDRDIDAAMTLWAARLEELLRKEFEQWFTFFPYFQEQDAAA